MPNLLSLSRIPAGFLFLLLLVEGKVFLSLLVFLMGALSDKLDGLFARIQGVEKDEVGKVIDPVSDRIFIALSF